MRFVLIISALIICSCDGGSATSDLGGSERFSDVEEMLFSNPNFIQFDRSIVSDTFQVAKIYPLSIESIYRTNESNAYFETEAFEIPGMDLIKYDLSFDRVELITTMVEVKNFKNEVINTHPMRFVFATNNSFFSRKADPYQDVLVFQEWPEESIIGDAIYIDYYHQDIRLRGTSYNNSFEGSKDSWFNFQFAGDSLSSCVFDRIFTLQYLANGYFYLTDEKTRVNSCFVLK